MRVALDVDGVLADFVGAWLKPINEMGGEPRLHPCHVGDFGFKTLLVSDYAKARAWRRVAEPGACLTMDSMPAGMALYRGLVSAGHDVVFVTTPLPSSPTWSHERTEWLRVHCGVDRSRVIHTSAKHLVDADVLVDDNLDNVLGFVAGGRHGPRLGVVWEQSWNAPPAGMRLPLGVLRTDLYGEVLAALEQGR